MLNSTLSLKFLTLVFSLAPVALSFPGLEFLESLAAHAAQLPAVHCLICCLAFGTPSSLHGQPSQACAHRWVLGLLNQLVTLKSVSFLNEPSLLLLQPCFSAPWLAVYAQTLISADISTFTGSVTANWKQVIKIRDVRQNASLVKEDTIPSAR